MHNFKDKSNNNSSMTILKRNLLACSMIFCSLAVGAQTQGKKCDVDSTTITGTYKGENLYFQNTSPNGIQTIIVDKQLVSTDFVSAFEIDFSTLNIKPGQSFELMIIYCKTNPVPYNILNLEAIK
jgi:hypothetical protein